MLSKAAKAGIVKPVKNKKKGEEPKKKKKQRTTYKLYDMKDAEMFSLCDAMRYVFPFYATSILLMNYF
jgi:large subunit ribosomal protein L1